MFSKEVSLENYVIQNLPRIFTVVNVSVFFKQINRSKIYLGNYDFGIIVSYRASKIDYVFYAEDKEISTSNHMFKREIWDKFTEFTFLRFQNFNK